MYWAMPNPRAKGREPRSRSWVRQPSIVVSRVTTRASAPAASARPIIESTSCSSVDQYSWYQKGVPAIARAVASMGELPWQEKT